MPGRILVVDDEPAIREMIRFCLSRAGFAYVEAADTREAETHLANELPDLVLLDCMMPGLSGIEFTRQLRSDPDTRSLPIILLTARGEEEDKVNGLRAGADDYVTKPFGGNELVARIEAVLRRTRPEANNQLVEVDGLALDPRSHRVSIHDQPVKLGPTEFRLLHVLMSQPERVYGREQLLDLVWGTNIHVGPRTVDMHVSNLRKALEVHGYGCLIETVRGTGYRLASGRHA